MKLQKNSCVVLDDSFDKALKSSAIDHLFRVISGKKNICVIIIFEIWDLRLELGFIFEIWDLESGFEIHFQNLGFGIKFQNLGFEIGIWDSFLKSGIWD